MAQADERRSTLTAADQRNDGVMLDLERLEEHMDGLYLTRFVEHIKRVRGEHGRYLTLRAGDELAIKAADDGSAEKLRHILADDAPE